MLNVCNSPLIYLLYTIGTFHWKNEPFAYQSAIRYMSTNFGIMIIYLSGIIPTYVTGIKCHYFT